MIHFNRAAYPPKGPDDYLMAGHRAVTPEYLSTLGVPLRRGRLLSNSDRESASPVVVINESMARQYWPKGNPIGERITIGRGLGPQFDEPPRQIVGVVGDVRDGSLNRDPQPIMYIPWAQLVDAHSANLLDITPIAWVVRTRGEPHALAGAIQSQLRQATGLAVARSRTMDEVVAQSTARSDFNMFLLTVFAGSALLLAAIGIYGLMSYSVQQRTQEIGIRVALGADSDRVRNMIVGQGMVIALVGVAIGLASAFGLTRVMQSFLFGVTTRDPAVFVAAPVILSMVALVGVWLPARRAARVDPAVTLRAE
jgi:predicted permease